MRRSVSFKDITVFAQLDMIYNQVRVIEANQNETKFKCLGSGNCCKVGLVIPMMECANIAYSLRQQYYLHLEDKGRKFADDWMSEVVNNLKKAMHDESWKPGGETDSFCAFHKGGCTIYGFRPMVCRSFGTITTVDDFCPRIRNAHNSIDYFAGPAVEKIIKEYQNLIQQYVDGKDENYDLTVYMPLGVLSFILTTEELEELRATTDDKFWTGVLGWFNYRVEFVRLHGHEKEYIEQSSKESGIPVAFKFE